MYIDSYSLEYQYVHILLCVAVESISFTVDKWFWFLFQSAALQYSPSMSFTSLSIVVGSCVAAIAAVFYFSKKSWSPASLMFTSQSIKWIMSTFSNPQSCYQRTDKINCQDWNLCSSGADYETCIWKWTLIPWKLEFWEKSCCRDNHLNAQATSSQLSSIITNQSTTNIMQWTWWLLWVRFEWLGELHLSFFT